MQNSAQIFPNNSAVRKVIARFVIYTLVMFAITTSLPLMIENGDISVFKEDGPIEWLQFTTMILSAIILWCCSYLKGCTLREIYRFLSLSATCAAVREMDSAFDDLIPIIGWKLPAGFCVLLAIIICWKNKDVMAVQMNSFVHTRFFSLLWCGFIVAVPIAQLVGNGKFLQLLMGDDYVRDYKRVIEELLELFGYLLILIGSLEAILQPKDQSANNAGGDE